MATYANVARSFLGRRGESETLPPERASTYKLQEESVLPQGADAAGEAQDEHHPAHHHEEPDGVEAPQVCDGVDVGKDTLMDEEQRVQKGCQRSHTLMILQSIHHP